jgi:hypothetical protein
MCFPTARICDATGVAGPHRDASPVLGPHRGCGFRWFIEFFFISLSHELKFHHEHRRCDSATWVSLQIKSPIADTVGRPQRTVTRADAAEGCGLDVGPSSGTNQALFLCILHYRVHLLVAAGLAK